MSKQIVLFLAAVFLFVGVDCAACAFAQEAATVEPKDSFEGWVQLGGKSKYEIKDGVITGTCSWAASPSTKSKTA